MHLLFNIIGNQERALPLTANLSTVDPSENKDFYQFYRTVITNSVRQDEILQKTYNLNKEALFLVNPVLSVSLIPRQLTYRPIFLDQLTNLDQESSSNQLPD